MRLWSARGVGVTSGIAMMCLGATAAAQPSAPGASPRAGARAAEQPRLRAQTARAQVQKGDCRKALDAYDAALLTSVDPELHRERGLCHEQLGHPYPAIDDYRAYLTAKPDAPPAEDIRARLARLEGQVGSSNVGIQRTHELRLGPGDAAYKEEPDDDTRESASARAEAGGGRASGSFSVRAGASTEEGGGPREEPTSIDAVVANEKRNDAVRNSPLRRGKGFILGPALGVRRWGEESFGWGETISASFRYSVGRVSTLQADLGYMSVSSSGVSPLGGFTAYLGYEARIALDRDVTNAFLLGFGGGYERLKQGEVGLVFNGFEGRGRFGYRHVFGPALGLEFVGEGGVAQLSLVDAPAGVSDKTTAFGGLTIALVVGF